MQAIAAPLAQAKFVLPKPTYPTGSLDFLRPLQEETRPDGCLPSTLRLKVLVSGAGVAGLATAVALARRGHTVTVFEQANQLAEVGAGIQLPPNSLRMLLQWGLGKFLHGRFIEPHNIFFRRWENGQVIGRTRYIPEFRAKFGAPYYVIHRAHLHDALHQLAVEHRVVIKLASQVSTVDVDNGCLSLLDGSIHRGDLIVAADGIHSGMRKSIFNGDAMPSGTKFAVYRCTLNVDDMMQDPDTARLFDQPNLNLWVGPGGHVMTYSIAGGKTFNIVVSRMDTSDPATWNPEHSLEEMRQYLWGWHSTLRNIIEMVKSTQKWPLLVVPTLQTWAQGKAVILGDAAHAMLPFMSQGAAIAVEDAAALAEAFHLVENTDQVLPALQVWEKVRRLRASQMQQANEINSVLWHYSDDPEQEARDASMRAEVEGAPTESSANQWSDFATQRWCYGYDCEFEIRSELRSYKRPEGRRA